jgi:hypothetical protein
METAGWDTAYKDLPPNLKAFVDRTYRHFVP